MLDARRIKAYSFAAQAEGPQRGGLSAAVAGRPPEEHAVRADRSENGRWVMRLGAIALLPSARPASRSAALALVLALLAAPLAAEAQQPKKVPRIGFLGLGPASGWAGPVEALRAGLRDLGYVEGKNIVIEFRWAARVDQMPELAANLVRMDVDVIF